MQRVGLIRVKIVNATKTLAAILSGQWLRRLDLLSLAPPLMAVVSIGQETGYHENMPQFTKMAISVKPEYDEPQMQVSLRTKYDWR